MVDASVCMQQRQVKIIVCDTGYDGGEGVQVEVKCVCALALMIHAIFP